MKLLDKTATIGDVVGWTCALILLTMTFVCAPGLPYIIGSLRPMFLALHGQLPLSTNVIIAIPGFLLPAPFILSTLMALFVLLKFVSNNIKALIPLIGTIICLLYIVLIVEGIFIPLYQLNHSVLN